jgi:ribosomal protein S18 acetylase RimI-like enzyme
VTRADLPAIKKIIDDNEMFPSEMLDEMIAPFFSLAEPVPYWLTFDSEGKALAVAFCAPEPMTSGTWNLYLIAVDKANQGQGIGQQLMKDLEERLKERGQRVLLVETSGLPDFERTRSFYDGCGYHREARIREFYAEGEDKIVFWKKLKQS